MSRHVNINDLISCVYNYYDITIAFFFKSLIFKIFEGVCRQNVILATIFLIIFYESCFLFAIIFYNNFDNLMIKCELQRIYVEII